MESHDKEVYFYQYCPLCKHRGVSEANDPCALCLDNPTNTDSHKPVYFEEK